MENMQFKNKVVLITGGTGGLGKYVTAAFFNSGAHTVVTYRQEEEYESLRIELGGVDGIMADVTDAGDVSAIVQELIRRYQKIDILANLVGGYIGKPFQETNEGDFDRMIGINLRSVFLCCKYVLPYMKERSYGKIINIGARSAAQPSSDASMYAASKAGVIALTQSLAEEFRGKNINVNCVLPSIIDTEANRIAMPDHDFTKWIDPRDLADVILFLASDKSAEINGAALPVYGCA